MSACSSPLPARLLRRGSPLLLALLALPALAAEPPALPSLRETKVELPWDDFKKLVEATFAPEEVAPPPPQSFAIDAVACQGEMKKGHLRATAKLDVTVLEPEAWVSVPLFAGVAVTAVRGLESASEGKGGALVLEGDRHQLLARGAGRRSFEVDFVVAGGDRPGQNTLSFETPAASVSHMRIVASAEVEKVETTSLVGAVATAEGKEILGAVPQTGQVALTYYLPLAKEAEGAGQVVAKEPKVLVEELTLATIGDELLTFSTTYRYAVLHAPVTTFRFRVPEGVEVLKATGENLVEDFKILKTDAGRELEARAGFEVKGAYEITVLYERELPGTADSAELALLEPLGVERATGVVGFEVAASAEVAASRTERMVPLDVSELPQEVWAKASRPLLMGFRYLARPFALALAITRHEDLPVTVAACDRAFVTLLVTDDGDTLGRGVYYVRNNRKSHLEVQLPAGAEISSVQVNGRPETPSKKEGAEGRILVKLPRSGEQGGGAGVSSPPAQVPAFPVEIIYLMQTPPLGRAAGSLELATPVVDVPVSELGLSLWLPTRRAYHFVSGTLHPQEVVSYAPSPFDTGGYASRSAPAPSATVPAAPAEGFEYQQLQEDRAFKGKVGRAAQSGSAGSLPVAMAFPEEGVNLRFRELLQIEEAGTVKLTYVHAALPALARMLVMLLGFAAGIALAAVANGRLRDGRTTVPARTGLLLGTSIVVAAAAALLLDVGLGSFALPGLLGLLGGAVVLAAQRGLHSIGGWRRSRTAGPPPAPPAAPPPPVAAS